MEYRSVEWIHASRPELTRNVKPTTGTVDGAKGNDGAVHGGSTSKRVYHRGTAGGKMGHMAVGQTFERGMALGLRAAIPSLGILGLPECLRGVSKVAWRMQAIDFS